MLQQRLAKVVGAHCIRINMIIAIVSLITETLFFVNFSSEFFFFYAELRTDKKK